MRKKIRVVILLACLGILFLNYFGNEKIRADSEKITTETSVFKNVSLSKYDSKVGTTAKTDLKNGDSIKYDDSFQVKYHVSIPNEMKLKKNQIFTTKVPYLTPTSTEPVEVKDKQGNILGKWEIADDFKESKLISFQVSEFFVGLKKREVDLTFIANLDSSVANKNQLLSFKFETNKESDLELKVLKISPLEKTTIDSTEKIKSEAQEKSTGKGIELKKGLKELEPQKTSADSKVETYSIKVNTVDADDHSIPINGRVVLFSYDDLSAPLKSVSTVNGEYTFIDLQPGKYRVAGGTSDVLGYYARRGATYFEVDLPSANPTVTIEYLKGWGSVKVTKRDESTNAVLPGAEFKLVKNKPDNTTEVVKEGLVSTDKGIVQVDQLFSGSYSFIETKAPDGYVLDSTPIDVSLKDRELVYPDSASKPLWFPTNMKNKTNKKAEVNMNNSTFPTNLDFGKTKIQNAKDETFTANENGIQTTGKVVIDDTRLNGGWTLKVKQEADFVTSEGSPLANTKLDLEVGQVTNTTSNIPSQVKELVSLKSGVENMIAVAKATEGVGTTTIPLEKFSLTVPKEANKKASQYTSSLTWTLSDVPQ
ncbi:WxL domain-containing protein [Enterococcus ureasiticus]|uniref:WxL domain-containing protein n=1 Tax=Enterococcus ureasiticus TaxID=903984 RepID=A0A1E5GF39_9ENTE|nr:WxL domain-containing protein [Enterococcus ureasiticus]OEG11334.1 hypothetical protein BCR21_08525 [Enterococcus ureasiticus]